MGKGKGEVGERGGKNGRERGGKGGTHKKRKPPNAPKASKALWLCDKKNASKASCENYGCAARKNGGAGGSVLSTICLGFQTPCRLAVDYT